MTFLPYESFQHGLVSSKLWLCEELEKHIGSHATVHILGSWTNLLSFMMIVRKPHFYKEFHGYDIDVESTEIADKICDTWKHESPKVYNHTINVDTINFSDFDESSIFINTSTEHMENDVWFDNIPKNRLVCVQSSDVSIIEHPWYIKQVAKDLDSFKNRFDFDTVLYAGTKRIQYTDWGFNRFMVIGIKK